MAVASIPYLVNVPYAVLETIDHEVRSFIEKPTYTYYSNGGIYFLKFALKNTLKTNEFFKRIKNIFLFKLKYIIVYMIRKKTNAAKSQKTADERNIKIEKIIIFFRLYLENRA